MTEDLAARVRQLVDTLYRAESRRVFATLVRLIGDFELAEDALQEAFAVAVDQWSREGVPIPRCIRFFQRYKGAGRRAARPSTPRPVLLRCRLVELLMRLRAPSRSTGNAS